MHEAKVIWITAINNWWWKRVPIVSRVEHYGGAGRSTRAHGREDKETTVAS